MFRTDMWDYVEYCYSGDEPIFHGEKPTGKLRFKRVNTSCENKHEAISNFCFWLNNGGLADSYYAVKCLNRIDIYKYRDEADKTDPEYYQPERVYQFWDFEFYNLEYRGRLCPAFIDVGFLFLEDDNMKKETRGKIFEFIGDKIQEAE